MSNVNRSQQIFAFRYPARQGTPSAFPWLTLTLCLLLASTRAVAAEKSEAAYEKEIVPLLKKYCFDCHGPTKRKGDLSFSDFTAYNDVLAARPVFTTALERVQSDEMPPEGATPMAYDHRQTLMRWLRELPADEADCDKLATDRTQSFYRGHVMSRRLNRHEYANTVRDLFGMDFDVHSLLPADGAGGEGFDTTGDTLFTSSLGVERFLQAADRILDTVLPETVATMPAAAKAARKQLLVREPRLKRQAREAAAAVLERFATLAYRRPIEGAELTRLVNLFDTKWAAGTRFDQALRLPLRAILVSPHFLFLVEPENPEGGIQPLGAFQLASRLSYFIWASMPDPELFRLAGTGELLQTNAYRAQIARMIRDPKARALGERFALQWLELDRFSEETRPDGRFYPDFDPPLAAAMRAEVTTFFNHIIQNDRPLTELLDADYTFANARLAAHYGLPAPSGDSWIQVMLSPETQRGGLLGMAAIQTATSYPTRTSPVLRGKWVLEVLLGDRVPPPPPDVPALKVDETHLTAASLREQLEIHRRDPNCSSCHNRMDPLGFGLETFDAIGRVRTAEAGQPVDATGTLPSGEKFTGPAGLRKVLMARRDQVLKHLTRKLAGYALGRPLNKFDDCIIRDSMNLLPQRGYAASAIIETIALSKPFRYRFHPKT